MSPGHECSVIPDAARPVGKLGTVHVRPAARRLSGHHPRRPVAECIGAAREGHQRMISHTLDWRLTN
jgi:hypothetical protein